jgi:hypothetical protein
VDSPLLTLCFGAVTVAFVHTVCGPDHYLPFVAMSQAGGWSFRKTVVVTLACGLGHVGSSIALGLVGIALGAAASRLEVIEAWRGGLAGWLLIGFGLAYSSWGFVRACRRRRHGHSDGTRHAHGRLEESNAPGGVPADVGLDDALDAAGSGRMTPWFLFVFFVLGPCEPLIPLLMVPAAQSTPGGVLLVSILFSLATMATMTWIVVLLVKGARTARLGGLHEYSHAASGLVVLLCGVAIKLGL